MIAVVVVLKNAPLQLLWCVVWTCWLVVVVVMGAVFEKALQAIFVVVGGGLVVDVVAMPSQDSSK